MTNPPSSPSAPLLLLPSAAASTKLLLQLLLPLLVLNSCCLLASAQPLAGQAPAKSAQHGLNRPLAQRQQNGFFDGSADSIERALDDPVQEWDRVARDDADFILMNSDEQALHNMGRVRRQEMKRDLDDYRFLDALIHNRPIYIDAPGSSIDSSNSNSLSKRSWQNKRSNKLLRLSLTNNIDVLREKLFMEIARRERLMNENQVNNANSGLASIG